MGTSKKWAQDAFPKKKSPKRGSLHRQLGVPMTQPIPKTLLERLNSAKIGSRVRNPTKIGNRRVTVTGLIKKRINPVITLNYPEIRRRN